MSSLERNENGALRRLQPRGRGHEADVLTLGFDTQLGSHRPAPVIVDDVEMMIQDAIDGLGQAFGWEDRDQERAFVNRQRYRRWCECGWLHPS